MSIDRRVDFVMQCDSPKCTNQVGPTQSRSALKSLAKAEGWNLWRQGESAYDWCQKCTQEAKVPR